MSLKTIEYDDILNELTQFFSKKEGNERFNDDMLNYEVISQNDVSINI